MDSGWKAEEVSEAISESAKEVLAVLTTRGEDYGPEILYRLRQEYPMTLIMAKAMRLWWYWKKHGQPHWDSVLDLVGYGLLSLAIRWLEKKETAA